jgi:geranylgeranyl diphosphate synthase type I
MNWLKSLYPQVRQVLEDTTPNDWPGLRMAIAKLFEPPIMTEAILPLAACRAVGGNPKDAIHVTAALLALAACLRLYDDLEDQDRPGGLWEEVGPARAWNYASAVHILSFEILNKTPLPLKRFRIINQLFIDSFFILAAGQDRDLSGITKTIEDYWLTIEMKSGCAYALACASGAMVGTDNPEWIEGCRTFGHHLGLAKMIFNDMESIWDPDGVTDLKQGKVTLPLVYGMSREHPCRDELLSLVNNGKLASNAERIKEILDNIDTKNFMLWAALKERDAALKALACCPNPEGKEALVSYITGMFGDIDSLQQK